MNDTIKVEAPAQAWEVLVGLLNIAVKSAGLDAAENAVYWLKTIQASARAAEETAKTPPAPVDPTVTTKHNPNAPKMTIVPNDEDPVKDDGAESPL